MKILFLTQYYPPEVGAPQNRIHELAVRLKTLGAKITVLTAMPNYPQMEIHEEYKGLKTHRETIDGIEVHRTSIYIPKKKSITERLKNYFSFVMSSYKYGKKLPDFDYIFCESPPLFLGYSAMKLSKKLKAKLIFNVSDLWPESAEKLNLVNNKFFLKMAYKLEAKCYKKSHFITGQTQGIVKDIKDRFPNKKVFWLPNGVDLSLFKPEETQTNWRSENGFNEDDFIFLYAGILGHAQGLEVIIKAAKKVQSNPKLKFILLGSGPEKEKLQNLKEELKTDNVYFFDAVSKKEIPSIIKAINCSIVPLKKLDLFLGAIPSKIFELLAMKTPILLGVDGEARDLFIKEGNSGLYFEPENENELAEQISKISYDFVLYNQLAENARIYVDKKFNRNNIAKDFWKILQEN